MFLSECSSDSRCAIAVAFVLALMSSSAWGASDAEDAYYQIEANVFDSEKVQAALTVVARARDANPTDPWIYLSGSLAVLVSGYKIGDWYSLGTFDEGTLEEALEWAARAKELGRRNSQAHAHMGRLLIVKGEYKEAWSALNEAHRLDPNNFYPWYFRGIIAKKHRDLVRARSYFDEADKRATRKHQSNLVNRHRQGVAELAGDVAEQERLLKENIARNPDRAHYYGNYAHFLKKHKRYDEAIEYWEKAIAISPYRHAISQLEETRRLKQSK